VAHWFAKTPVKHFEPTTDGDGTVALLESIGDDHRSVQEVLAEQADAARPAPKTEEIDLWLKAELSNGSVHSVDLEATALAEGYSKDQLRGARKRVDAKSRRVGDKWMVSL
jgi:hypothetical protein